MEIELRTVIEFYEHTARSFQHKLRAIERDFAATPKSERERDLATGRRWKSLRPISVTNWKSS
jgi:hypothetical protein